MVRKKIDNRIRVLIENCVQKGHRKIIMKYIRLVGNKGKALPVEKKEERGKEINEIVFITIVQTITLGERKKTTINKSNK